jgi:hypothetical protein
VKFSTTGGTVWANMDADSTFSLLAHAQMKMDSQNNIYLAAGTMTQMAVCKVKNTGSSGWTIAIPGSGYAYALDFGSDNSVYVVGGNTAGATARLSQPITSISNYGNSNSENFWLGNSYPNPFNPTTNIKFNVAKLSDVNISVYDIMGREVQTLVNKRLQPGTYDVLFEGSSLNSGVYFYRLKAGNYSETKKMLLVK